jgi:SAM-dependent methyltransferase
VVDLGGGTGNFTAALAAAAALTHPIVCVDNSAPMLAVAAGRAGVIPREQDAVAFAAATDAQASGYDRVLLKELVHHIPEADAGAMYAGLARQLAPGGLAVTVTRPREVDYPLWPAARQVWRDAQPPAERMCAQMAAAGLVVRTEEATYTATMPKGRWVDMVRSIVCEVCLLVAASARRSGMRTCTLHHTHSCDASVLRPRGVVCCMMSRCAPAFGPPFRRSTTRASRLASRRWKQRMRTRTSSRSTTACSSSSAQSRPQPATPLQPATSM